MQEIQPKEIIEERSGSSSGFVPATTEKEENK